MNTRLPFLVLAGILVAASASAQKIIGPELEKIPPDATAYHATAMSKVSTVVRSWIAEQAHAASQATTAVSVTESTLRRSIVARFKGQSLRTADVDALLAVTLAEIDRSTRKTFEEIQRQTDEVAKLKQQIDKLEDEVRETSEEKASQNPLDVCTGAGCSRVNLRIDSILAAQRAAQIANPIVTGRISTVGDLNALIESMRDRRDSISELGEQLQLRLQTLQDRHAKLLAAISNAMKKASETSQQIIANLK